MVSFDVRRRRASWQQQRPSLMTSALAALDERVAALASVAGLPADQMRMVLSLLVAYPIAAIDSTLLRRAPPAARHTFALLIGLVLGAWMFGREMVHPLVTTLGAFLVFTRAPPRLASRLIFGVTMAYLFAMHLYRMYTDYMGWSMDVTVRAWRAATAVAARVCDIAA